MAGKIRFRGDWLGAIRESFERAEVALTKRNVHGVRQEFKLARAILRLGEDAGFVAAKPLRLAISRLARKFAALRDAKVAFKVANKLVRGSAGSSPAEPIPLGLKLQIPPPAWWAAREDDLVRITGRLTRLGKIKLTQLELRKSLRHSAKRLHRHAKRVTENCKSATVHEWRKRVLVMRNQISFAKTLNRAKNEELHKGLAKLSQRLGEVTDYRVFITTVSKNSRSLPHDGAGSKIIALAQKKQSRALIRAQRRWKKVWHLLRGEI